jgi:hypothetical protein
MLDKFSVGKSDFSFFLYSLTHNPLFSLFLQIPSHIYHIVFEVMKNAMQATVDKFLDKTDVLPPIKEQQQLNIIIFCLEFRMVTGTCLFLLYLAIFKSIS